MALQYRKTTQTIDDLTRQVKFENPNGPEQTEQRSTFLPSEWFPQSGVQLTWPHAETDWCDMLPEVTDCYLHMAYEIASREKLLIVTPEPEAVRQLLQTKLPARTLENIILTECPTNDTWARDHGFLTLITENGPMLLDFKLNFIIEGGSIESDGAGTILTSSECLLSPNRNETYQRPDVEQRLKSEFHAEQILWVDHGYLSGDDTDSHIDTLARLCPNNTIAYVQCTDSSDEHYEALTRMEEQIKSFRTLEGEPYHLIPLPMPAAIHDEDGTRLPATYANFLIVNGAVLMPTYGQPANDELARKQLQKAFPKHEIVGIDCCSLIRQHGSLHCCTMQFPLGVL